MFPRVEEDGSYNRGSDSDVAPNLDALMQASLAVISPLNDIIETFENQLGDETHPASEMFIDCEWQQTFLNLGVMLNEIRRIPMQAGNEGSSGEPNQVAQNLNVALPSTYPQPVQPGAQAPAVVQAPPQPTPASQMHAPVAAPPAPAPVASSPAPANRQSLEGFLAEREAQKAREQQQSPSWMPAAGHVPQQPQVFHQPQQQPYYPQPVHAMPMQGYAPAPLPQAPHLVHTGRGLDFTSVLQSNPSVAYAAGGYPVQQAPVQQGSRWAQQASQPQSMYPQQNGYYPGAQGHQRLV
jgi:hypothetical protein